MTEVYRGIWVVAYRELLRVYYERSQLVFLVVTPLLILAIMGVGFGSVVGSLTPEVDYLEFLFPGVIAINVIFGSLGIGASVVWDREHGFLKELMVAPMSRIGIVLGKAFGGAGIVLGNAVVLLLVAPTIGLSVGPTVVLKMTPILLLMSLSLSGLGLLLATMMRSQRGYGLAIQVLQFPLVFLSGTFFPVDNLPIWLRVPAQFNPVTYGVDGIRQVILGPDASAAAAAIAADGARSLGVTVLGHPMSLAEEMLVVGALAVVLLAAGVWSFSRQE